MKSSHVFGKPVIRYSEIISLEDEISDVKINTRKKILQKYQILAKLRGIVYDGSPFEYGIRPVDLADTLDIPQATVRKFLNEFVKECKASVIKLSGNHSVFKPL